MVSISDIAILIGVPVARSVAGWATTALEDNKINKFEVQQLLATIVRVGILSTMAYLGLQSAGVDQAALVGAVSGFFADKVFSAMKK
jgi:hypothetical protein